jgi:hypothetical protein
VCVCVCVGKGMLAIEIKSPNSLKGWVCMKTPIGSPRKCSAQSILHIAAPRFFNSVDGVWKWSAPWWHWVEMGCGRGAMVDFSPEWIQEPVGLSLWPETEIYFSLARTVSYFTIFLHYKTPSWECGWLQLPQAAILECLSFMILGLHPQNEGLGSGGALLGRQGSQRFLAQRQMPLEMGSCCCFWTPPSCACA